MADIGKLLCEELKLQLEAKGPRKIRLPAGGDLLWKWFIDLHKTRQIGVAGPQAIQFYEIEAYNRLTREGIESHHVKIITAMDRVYLETVYKNRKPLPDGVKALPPVSSTPLSAGLIDAMFG